MLAKKRTIGGGTKNEEFDKKDNSNVLYVRSGCFEYKH